MNTKKEAASPVLIIQAMPSGSGVCRAMLRGRLSSLKDADASPRRSACRPVLDPGDLYGPWGRWCEQARACPDDRRGTPITTYHQDQKAQNYMIEVSTVSGDCQLRPLMAPEQPNAPPELRQALDTIDRIVTRRIADARVPTTF